MRSDINRVLILLVVASATFVAGYVGGWSKAHLGQTEAAAAPVSASPPASVAGATPTIPLPVSEMAPPSTAPVAVLSGVQSPAPVVPAAPPPAIKAAGSSPQLASVPAPSPQAAKPVAAGSAATPVERAPAKVVSLAASEKTVPRQSAARPNGAPTAVPVSAPAPSPTGVAPTRTSPAGGASNPQSALPAPAKGSPGIRFEATTYDYGAVDEGTNVDHVFRLTNVGDVDLVIGKVTTSCGCTAALASANLIAPGGSGEIKVSFRTQGYKGKVTRYIYVESNDPAAAKVTLQMAGTVKREIDTDQSYVFFTSVNQGETPTKSVRIFSTTGKPFTVASVTTTSPSFRLSPVRASSQGGFDFDVTLASELKPGMVSGAAVIATDSPRQPKLTIPLMANVRAPGGAKQ